MGGISTSGASGRYSPFEAVIQRSDYHKDMTERYLWWLNKRNEILGQMMEDIDFQKYVLAYEEENSPHIEVDKQYLSKAIDYLDAIEAEMDYEVTKDVFPKSEGG